MGRVFEAADNGVLWVDGFVQLFCSLKNYEPWTCVLDFCHLKGAEK